MSQEQSYLLYSSCIYCINQFLLEKRHKNETKNVKKNSLVCSIFVIFLIFWPLELRKQYGDPQFLNLIFKYFRIMKNSGKFKEISSTRSYCIIPP